MKKYEEAIEAYHRALERYPDYLGALKNNGDALLKLGKYEDALNFVNYALEIDPQCAETYRLRGNIFFQLGKYEEAIEAYNKALEIDPMSANSYNNKGKALLRLRRYEEAKTLFEKALDYSSDPKNKYEIFFPFQLVFFLNEPEVDYTGGEFALTEQIPRAQSKAIVLKPHKGDMLIITTNFRPIKGNKGYFRAQIRHGVSEVHDGERYVLGIIFHDALT